MLLKELNQVSGSVQREGGLSIQWTGFVFLKEEERKTVEAGEDNLREIAG